MRAESSPEASNDRASSTTRCERRVVGIIAAVAGVAGLFAGVHPTALVGADVVLVAGFCVGVSLAGSRAAQWSWYVPATVAAGLAPSPWLLPGVAALLITIWASWGPRAVRPVGAVVGGLSAVGLLHLPDWEPFGLSAAVAAVAVVPVAISAIRHSGPRTRRGIAVATGSCGALVAVFGAVAALVVLGQRSAVEAGIDAADSGLRAAEAGDDTRAVALLEQAATQFGDANDAFSAPWMRPALAVPVLGQHVDALDTVSAEGAALAALASDAVVEADLDSLRFDDGTISVERLRALDPPLSRSAAGLTEAMEVVDDVAVEWLVGPVRSRVDRFSDQVGDAAADADVALDALQVAPSLFGGDGDRRYFVIFTTPAESRGLGGFIGNYGELTAVDGDLELTRSGRLANELGPPFGTDPYVISGPQDYLDHYNRFQPDVFIQDTSFSPDFPTVAEVWGELYPQVPGGADIDGVIMVDPFGLAGLLEFTGPITVAGRAEPLTSDNAAAFLLRDQYLDFPVDNERVDFLDEASRLTFEALTRGDIPGPRPVIDVLGPLVRGGHLAVESFHPDERALFARTGISGAFPPVVSDFVALTGQNAGNSKIDIFSRRAIDYAATVDPDTGLVEATATITLANDAPSDGLPSDVLRNGLPGRVPGTNSTYLSWYSPLQLESMTVQGFDAVVETHRELDRNVYSRRIDVPPGETYTIVIELRGAVAGGATYQLDVAGQPMVNDDRVTVEIGPAEGWAIDRVVGADTRDGHATLDESLSEDITLIVHFSPR